MMHLKATQMPIGILIKTISILIFQYYIFDIKERYDDVHGDIIIVRAGKIHDSSFRTAIFMRYFSSKRYSILLYSLLWYYISLP